MMKKNPSATQRFRSSARCQVAALAMVASLSASLTNAEITSTGEVSVQTLDFIAIEPQPSIGPGDTDLGVDLLVGIGASDGMLAVDGGNVLRAGRLVGFATNGIATVNVSGQGSRIELETAAAPSNSRLNIADQGTATVSISNGGVVALTTAPGVCGDFECTAAVLSNAAGSTSEFIITGEGSTLDLDIGSPQIAIFGQDDVFTLEQDGFDFGTAGATSALSIDVLGGGQLFTRYAGVAVAGQSASGNGQERVESIITVDGAGSVWADSYLIFVGFNVAQAGTPQVNAVSDGRITVSNGGAVTTPQLQVGPGGTVDVLTGGQVSASAGFFDGIANVSGAGSSLAMANSLNADGPIMVSGGGAMSAPLLWVQSGGSVGIAGGEVGSGVVQVDGQLEMTGAESLLALAEADGIFGVGMTIGVLDSVGTGIAQEGATITLDGFGAAATTVGVGYGGIGDLTLESGASLLLRDPNLIGENDGVTIGASLLFGEDFAGTGTLTLRDEGTRLDVNGNLGFVLVGVSGASFTGTSNAVGTLNITDGADLFIEGNDDLGALEAGRGGNATGTINVSGAGTLVQLSGEPGLLSIGNNYLGAVGSGAGMLTVSQGAMIHVGAGVNASGMFTIGNGESQGTVIVDTGGQITVDSSVRGPAPGGLVEVGGPASAGGALQIDGTGVVSATRVDVVANGRLTGTGFVESDVVVSGGELAPGLSSDLSVVGDVQIAEGRLVFQIGGHATDQYGQLTVSGELEVAGGEIVFDFLDGFTPGVGDSFAVLDAMSVSAVMPEFVTLGLPGGLELDVELGIDGITVGVVSADTDDDGVNDLDDNCIEVANANQRDSDGDGFGNLCDADLDNGCSVNFLDLAQMKSVFFTNDDDADLDGDGSVNFLDLALMKAAFFLPPGPSGIANICNDR